MKSVAVALFIYLHATEFGLVFSEGSVRKTAGKPYADIRTERDGADGLTELVTDLSQTPGWKYLNKESCGIDPTTNEILKRSNKGKYIKDLSGRIFGGLLANTGEYPWMARVLLRIGMQLYICGGSLISKRHVLTAAHCAIGDQSEVRVGAGQYFQTVLVKEVIIHGDYFVNHTTIKNDIALLVLETDVALNDFVTPVCLPLGDDRYKTFAGETGIVAGWGKTETSVTSDHLLALAVPILKNDDCMKTVKYRNLTSQQLCAGGEEGKSTCNGDSGGPLLTIDESSKRYSIVGVVSQGETDCGQKGDPGVYSRVTYFLSWILNNMN